MKLAFILLSGLAAAPDPLLFDAGAKGWLVLSRDGEVLQQLRTLNGRRPEDAAIAPDGRRWAFIHERILYLWEPSWPVAKEVVPAGDVLQTPTFSRDGRWVYFIQNDFATMFRKTDSMRYSQVWRVPSAGGRPEKLTTSVGCHMWPVPLPNGNALFTHATCQGGRGVDLLAAGKETQLLDTTVDHAEAAIDPKGQRALVIRDADGVMQVVELNLATKKEKTWARLPWRAARLRPGWNGDGTFGWLQNADGLWKVSSDGALTEHLSFATLQEPK